MKIYLGRFGKSLGTFWFWDVLTGYLLLHRYVFLSAEPFAVCDFEGTPGASAACEITTVPQGSWAIQQGPTPTAGTGPAADHTTGSGMMLYEDYCYFTVSKCVTAKGNISSRKYPETRLRGFTT